LAIGFTDEGFADDAIGKVVRVANATREAKKKAEKATFNALKLAQLEIKQKAKAIDLRKIDLAKKRMRYYFESTKSSGGQPLELVFNGCLNDVLGEEPNFVEDYPNCRLRSCKENQSVSFETETFFDSSSGSSNTRVLSSKSPIIVVSSDSDPMV